jgi:hypothetical protein
MKRRLFLPVVLAFIVHFSLQPAHAQFTSDPDRTYFICNAPNVQTEVRAFGDGSDGYFAVWIDRRDLTAGSAIYAQRLDSAGNPLWTPNGKGLYHTAGREIWNIASVPWRKGFLVAWVQGGFGSGGDSLFCDYFDSDGRSQWAQPTVVSYKTSGIIYVAFNSLNIYPNDSGATITYSLTPGGANDFFTFNRIDSSGTLRWPVNNFSYVNGDYYYVTCSDNHGGFYVATSTGGIGEHIHVQHFDIQGNLLYPQGGVDVSQSAGGRNNGWLILSDPDMNAYVVWDRSGGDIVASKLTPSGGFAWPSQYRTICDAAGEQSFVHAILKGNALYVTW